MNAASINNVSFAEETFSESSEEEEFFQNALSLCSAPSLTVPGEEVHLLDDGQITVDGQTMKPTQSAIESLCRSLRIPDPFAKRIPISLLQENITRLSRGHDITAFHSPTNNHWVGLTARPNIVPGALEPLLGHLRKMEGLQLFKGSASESQINVDLVMPIEPVQIKVGDISRICMRVGMSPVGLSLPYAQLMVYRLICTNGAVMSRLFGSARFKRAGDLAPRMLSFMSKLTGLSQKGSGLASIYNQVGQSELLPTNRDILRIWKASNKILRDPEAADTVLGIDEELRKDLKAAVRLERSEDQDSLMALGEEDDEDSETTETPIKIPLWHRSWWETFNLVTFAANKYKGRARYRMQNLGGRILTTAARAKI